MPRKRVSADKRSRLILKSVLPLFAQSGLHGATVKDLAAAAGVSEALLYRHYPSKQHLYEAAQCYCLDQLFLDKAMVLSMTPSTETLVRLLWYLFNRMLITAKSKRRKRDLIYRFIFRSYLDDAALARKVNSEVFGDLVALMEASLKAAEAAGDLSSLSPHPSNAVWFSQHVCAHVIFMSLSDEKDRCYTGRKDSLLQDLCLFSLRGMGLNKKAIQRYGDFVSLTDWLYALEPVETL